MSVIATIIDVAFDVGKYIAQAIQEGDEAKWRPIADVLPEPRPPGEPALYPTRSSTR